MTTTITLKIDDDHLATRLRTEALLEGTTLENHVLNCIRRDQKERDRKVKYHESRKATSGAGH